MKAISKIILAAILVIGIAAAYSIADAANKADPAVKSADKRNLRFAVHPYLSPGEIFSRFIPLADYLSGKLGQEVILEVSSDYSEHTENIGTGNTDLAFMGPAAYVSLTERHASHYPLLAAIEVDGRSTFRGVIVVKDGSRIRHLTDLIGKTFAFGDKRSTMSHIVPRYMLLEEGVPAAALKSYSFLTNHENVALSVLYGKYDAGAVKYEVFEDYKFSGLKALARTPLISEHIFVASPKLPPALVRRIREALLDLNTSEDGFSILFPIKNNITGLVPASDHDYDNLRRMMRTLEASGAIRR